MKNIRKQREGDTIFGMISPHFATLEKRDKRVYQTYYCGMCNALGQYGRLLGKCTLSNDIVFAYLLMDGLEESDGVVRKCRCAKGIGRKKTCLNRRHITDYLTVANIILFYEKLIDNILDDHSFLCRCLHRIYARSYNEAKEKYPELQENVEQAMLQIRGLEMQEADYRELAQQFGKVIRYLFENSPIEETDRVLLGCLGEWLGKWIYVMDAWKDYYQDRKKGKFNPIENVHKRLPESLYNELIEYLSECQVHIQECLMLVGVQRNKTILMNIVYESMSGQVGILLKREKSYES